MIDISMLFRRTRATHGPTSSILQKMKDIKKVRQDCEILVEMRVSMI
jgi:hypothetical protein